jgi:hypothetical protein
MGSVQKKNANTDQEVQAEDELWRRLKILLQVFE